MTSHCDHNRAAVLTYLGTARPRANHSAGRRFRKTARQGQVPPPLPARVPPRIVRTRHRKRAGKAPRSGGGRPMTARFRRYVTAAFAAAAALMLVETAAAQECKNRGQLDTLYCDDNNDLVADAPTDPRKLKDPATLVFAYTPVEDPAVYQNAFKPFTDYPGAMHRQARGLLSGAVELGRDRGDALGPPARRGLLDRPDRLRGQSRRRRAVRRQGHREGPAGLSSDLDRAKRQPVPEALRPQGQARRAHLAVVEFGQSRAAGALSAGRAQAERGLQAADVRRA